MFQQELVEGKVYQLMIPFILQLHYKEGTHYIF